MGTQEQNEDERIGELDDKQIKIIQSTEQKKKIETKIEQSSHTCTRTIKDVLFVVSETSVQFSHSVMSNSLQPHGMQHTRLCCPSTTSGVYSNSRPLSW